MVVLVARLYNDQTSIKPYLLRLTSTFGLSITDLINKPLDDVFNGLLLHSLSMIGIGLSFCLPQLKVLCSHISL
jgi:hypothetical protein